MKESNPQNLYGPFYDFVSYKDWYVIRKYEGRNGATLETWLSRCAINYFRKLKAKSNEEKKRTFSLSEKQGCFLYNSVHDEIYTSMIDDCVIGVMDDDDVASKNNILNAFSRLNERDQMVLKLLVIENNNTIEIAPTLFAYRKGGLAIEQMTTKQIQDTISIMKKRACAKLLLEYKKMMSYE